MSYIVSISYPTFTSALIRTDQHCNDIKDSYTVICKIFDVAKMLRSIESRLQERSFLYFTIKHPESRKFRVPLFLSFPVLQQRTAFSVIWPPSGSFHETISRNIVFLSFRLATAIIYSIYIYTHIYIHAANANNFTASRNENILEPPSFLYELQNRAIKEGSMCFPYGIRFRTL